MKINFELDTSSREDIASLSRISAAFSGEAPPAVAGNLKPIKAETKKPDVADGAALADMTTGRVTIGQVREVAAKKKSSDVKAALTLIEADMLSKIPADKLSEFLDMITPLANK